MSDLQWTTNGFLGSFDGGTGTSVTVTATNAISYSVISGKLPNNLHLDNTGLISGFVKPTVGVTTSTFVIRATSGVTGKISDKTFQIAVKKSAGPVWVLNTGTSTHTLLGPSINNFFINKETVHQPMPVIPPVPTPENYNITYKLISDGSTLPNGLTLLSNGVLSGIIDLILAPDVIQTYKFTVEATDGVTSSTQQLTMSVIDSNTFRVDTQLLTFNYDVSSTASIYVGTFTQAVSVFTSTYASSSTVSAILPLTFTTPSNLGTYRSNDNIYIPITVYEPDSTLGVVTFNTGTSTIFPPGVSLDPVTGYIYGFVPSQSEYLITYPITVIANKVESRSGNITSATNTFTLTILHNEENVISWITPPDLGSINQNTNAYIKISATHTESKYDLKYSIVNGSFPNGLTLGEFGDLYGSTTVTGTYTATVVASTGTYTTMLWNNSVASNSYPYAFNSRKFNLQVVTPSHFYTNIYLKPFLPIAQQHSFKEYLSRTDIFIPEIIYNKDDPNFSIQPELKVYIEYGIEQLNLDDYAAAMDHNFHKKDLYFGKVESMTALDQNGNPVYDVVYVNIVDTQEGINQSEIINGTTYWPSSISNMQKSLESLNSGNILVNAGLRPLFVQTAIASGKGFPIVSVLCYTLPNQGYKVVNRIRKTPYAFNHISFTIDRINVEQTLDNLGVQYLIFPSSTL
jgi:hypothetical protein